MDDSRLNDAPNPVKCRGPIRVVTAARYIPGVKVVDGDATADTLERAADEVIRLRTWFHVVHDSLKGEGALSAHQRDVLLTAATDALTDAKPPEMVGFRMTVLPGF